MHAMGLPAAVVSECHDLTARIFETLKGHGERRQETG
jgi:hypothetical protein